MHSGDKEVAPRLRDRLVLHSEAMNAVNDQERAIRLIAPGVYPLTTF
jgi:hypothetical protein